VRDKKVLLLRRSRPKAPARDKVVFAALLPGFLGLGGQGNEGLQTAIAAYR